MRRKKFRKKSSAHPRHNSACNSSLALAQINDVDAAQLSGAKIFLLETSGHGWFYARSGQDNNVICYRSHSSIIKASQIVIVQTGLCYRVSSTEVWTGGDGGPDGLQAGAGRQHHLPALHVRPHQPTLLHGQHLQSGSQHSTPVISP